MENLQVQQACPLTKLPVDMLEEMTRYLNIDDAARLDTAMCVHAFREDWPLTLRSPTLVFRNVMESPYFDRPNTTVQQGIERREVFVQWLVSRHVHIGIINSSSSPYSGSAFRDLAAESLDVLITAGCLDRLGEFQGNSHITDTLLAALLYRCIGTLEKIDLCGCCHVQAHPSCAHAVIPLASSSCMPRSSCCVNAGNCLTSLPTSGSPRMDSYRLYSSVI